MDNSKITIEFDTSHAGQENKFRFIESYIRNFLDRYFLNFKIEKNTRVILAKNVGDTKKRITGNKNDAIDNSIASATFLGEQFIIIFSIDTFTSELFSEEAKEALENYRLITNHMIYHEVQHIKNRCNHPILAQILDNTSAIPDSYTYFKLSASRFVDEYLATANS